MMANDGYFTFLDLKTINDGYGYFAFMDMKTVNDR